MADQKFWITKANAKKLTPKDVQKHVDNGEDINITDHEGVTLLMVATDYTKYGTLVQALIDAGADVNAKDEFGYTALMLTKEIEVIKVLLKAGADVHVKDKMDKATPLMHVLQAKGKEDAIKALIDAGSDLNAVKKEEATPLTIAIDQKLSAKIVKQLLNAGADIHYKKGTPYSPIEIALSASASTPVFKVLLEAGAEITKESIKRNNFSNATAEKLFEKYLLKDEKTQTKTSKTKTTSKATNGKYWLSERQAKSMTVEKLEQLIEKGVDVNARNKDDNNQTPLMDLLDYYKGENMLEIVQTLLKAGATLNNFSESHGYTELMRALSTVRDLDVVKLLINSGADVNFSGGKGYIPLTTLTFSSISHGSKKFKDKAKLCTEYAKLLLEAGANPNVKLTLIFPNGQKSSKINSLLSDLSLANSGMPIETFQLLLGAGAKVNDKNGKSSSLTSSISTICEPNVELCKLLLNSGAKPQAEFFKNLTEQSHPDYRAERLNVLRRQKCAEIRKCLAKNNIPDKSKP